MKRVLAIAVLLVSAILVSAQSFARGGYGPGQGPGTGHPGWGQGPGTGHPGWGQGPGTGHPGFGQPGFGHPGVGGRHGGYDHSDPFTRQCRIYTHPSERFISADCQGPRGRWLRVTGFDSMGCLPSTITFNRGGLLCQKGPAFGGGHQPPHHPPVHGYYDVRMAQCISSVIGQAVFCPVVIRPDRYIESVTPVQTTFGNGSMCQYGASYGIAPDRRSIWALPRCSGQFRVVVRGAL